MIKLGSVTLNKAAAGDSHSMLLSTTGEVYSFGSSEFGKLGLGQLKSSVQVNSPTLIPELKNIFQISCGENHSLAINNKNLMFL